MATIAVEVTTAAAPSLVWDAIRDIGALHTRLVRVRRGHGTGTRWAKSDLRQRLSCRRTDHLLERRHPPFGVDRAERGLGGSHPLQRCRAGISQGSWR